MPEVTPVPGPNRPHAVLTVSAVRRAFFSADVRRGRFVPGPPRPPRPCFYRPVRTEVALALGGSAVLALLAVVVRRAVRRATRERATLRLVLGVLGEEGGLRLLDAHARRSDTWWTDAEPAERQQVDQALGTWDLLAWYVGTGRAELGVVLDLFRLRIIDTWEQAYLYIRVRRTGQPGLWACFEELYAAAYDAAPRAVQGAERFAWAEAPRELDVEQAPRRPTFGLEDVTEDVPAPPPALSVSPQPEPEPEPELDGLSHDAFGRPAPGPPEPRLGRVRAALTDASPLLGARRPARPGSGPVVPHPAAYEQVIDLDAAPARSGLERPFH